jgi:hypothetical protein
MVALHDALGNPILGGRNLRTINHSDGQRYRWNGNTWIANATPTSAISPMITLPQPLLKSEGAIIADIINMSDGDWNKYSNLRRLPNGIIQYTPEPSISWISEKILETAIKTRIEEIEIEKEKDRINLEGASIGSAVVQIPTTTGVFMIMTAIVVGLGAVIVSRFFEPESLIGFYISQALLVSGFFLGGFIIMRMREAKTVAREGAKLYWQNSLSTD